MEIPKIGFGTYRLRGDSAYENTLYALQVGYRHIDTACLYRNEEEVGRAIRDSGLRREEIWVTTKIKLDDIKKGREAMLESVLNSLNHLGYIDLLLLHAPTQTVLEDWKNLEDIYQKQLTEFKLASHKIRYIGVSNYGIEDLKMLKECRNQPFANQFEVSPYLNRESLILWCKNNGIIPVAHSSLTKGEKFSDDKLVKLSQDTNLSRSSLLLGWAMHKDLIVLPRSSKKEHILDNLRSDVNLTESIIQTLDSFNENYFTHKQYNRQ